MTEDQAIEVMVRGNLTLSPHEIQAVQAASELGLPPEAVDFAMECEEESM